MGKTVQRVLCRKFYLPPTLTSRDIEPFVFSCCVMTLEGWDRSPSGLQLFSLYLELSEWKLKFFKNPGIPFSKSFHLSCPHKNRCHCPSQGCLLCLLASQSKESFLFWLFLDFHPSKGVEVRYGNNNGGSKKKRPHAGKARIPGSEGHTPPPPVENGAQIAKGSGLGPHQGRQKTVVVAPQTPPPPGKHGPRTPQQGRAFV